MTHIKFEDLVRIMVKERWVFHSEGDLQHTLAKLIEMKTPNPRITQEYPSRLISGDNSVGGAVDIWWRNRRAAIELKYKTIPFEGKVQGDRYELKRHLTHNGRYGFVKDVSKLEKLVMKGSARKGYALLITNDERLWSASRSEAGASSQFSLEGILEENMEWNPPEKKKSIRLENSYPLKWKSYSDFNDCQFKYLLVRVG